MRIAFYLPCLAPSGAERAAFCVAQDIQRRGYDVRVIVDTSGASNEIMPANLPVEYLKAPNPALAGAKLAASLKREPADVLIAVTTRAILTAALTRKLGALRTKLVGWEYDLPALLAGPRSRDKLTAQMVRALFPVCDRVVFPSTYAADDAARLIPRLRATHIHGPVPLPLWQPPTQAEVEIEARLKAPRIVTFGPLTTDSDHLTLLRAFQIFARVKGGSLLLIGSGPARNMLEVSATGLGLGQRIAFAGAVDSPVNLLNLGDMFVASPRVDATGDALVQALALGLPVVSTDCPGAPREILANGKFGRLAQVGDPRALWHAMRDTADSRHDRDAARKRAAEFSVERAADRLLDLLGVQPEATPDQRAA